MKVRVRKTSDSLGNGDTLAFDISSTDSTQLLRSNGSATQRHTNSDSKLQFHPKNQLSKKVG